MANDTLTGTDAPDTLSGGAGNDLLDGGAGPDTLWGGIGNDLLHGGDGNDRLFGGDDDDALYADGGGDYLSGGAGNDTLGSDDASSTLLGGLGNDSLTGTGAIADGGAGDDFISGAYATLSAGAGNDTVRGDYYQSGVIDGGGGYDQYWLGGDSMAGGVALLRNVEEVHCTGSWGSTNHDIVISDAVVAAGAKLTVYDAYHFDGSAETDGRLTLVGDDRADVYIGGAGTDTLQGFDGADNLRGGDGADLLKGGAGNDTLAGGRGADKLVAGLGIDVLVFDTKPANTAVDVIKDFVHLGDKISLENSVFTALAATGPLSSELFVSAIDITGAAGATVASDDRLLYDSDSGHLYYDSNGSASGGRVLIATVWSDSTHHPALSAADFIVT
jgi:Ca2+-binding RTX toxin-like protein